MGLLIDGVWHDQDQRRANESGEFVRADSSFRAAIGAADGRFPATSGRYHLFVNAGCPWAYRTVLYRSLKNLDAVVSISFTAPAAGSQGWTFGDTAEPILGARHIHNIYSLADPSFTGRATVPVLWDLEERTIVNNESADIIRMFNSAFNGIEGVSAVDFYPDEHATEIDQLNALIYDTVNNGVYRCGFAQSQQAYEQAYDALFETLDQLDARLAGQRYLCGDVITEVDWRLFSTLVRFDLAYYSQFRCNRNRLIDFAHLWPYTRDLYQQPEVAATVDVAAIKGIYYGGRAPGILPKGPDINFGEPHQRENMTVGP
jgi:putative glutathione S-transferase